MGVAVVAGAVTLGVDALVTPLSGAALFALSGVLTGLGLWVFFPVATPRRQPLRARAGAAILLILFMVGSTVSAIALHGLAAIGLGLASLVPAVLAYVVTRRSAR
jgi:hypothetical protein